VYRDQKALDAHLAEVRGRSSPGVAPLLRGTPDGIDPTFVRRIGGFVHLDVP
jgi:hypothetical protein